MVDDAQVQRTLEALAARNFEAEVFESSAQALEALKGLIPEGAQIFTGTSETLDSIGYTDFVHHNPIYNNLHDEIDSEPDQAKQRDLRRRATIVEYCVGSVQAISETGEIVIASASGSQIGAYAYGAKHLILVAGTQKICPSLTDAIARVRGHTVEKHDQWLAGRGRGPAPIGKLLILEHEIAAGRVQVVLIKENLGW